MKKLWGSRFSKKTDKLAEKFSESISFDWRLYKYDISGSLAHVKMLAKQRIIPAGDAAKIISALKEIEKQIVARAASGALRLDPAYEDIHTYIEKEVVRLAGEKAGLKMHTARSRNDQIALDIRMFVREEAQKTAGLLRKVRAALAAVSKKHGKTLFPAFTHLQVASSVSFGTYLGAFSEMFTRDEQRLTECARRLNYSPLGAGAAAGTTLNIDRKFTARELGFAGVIKNTVDAISDRDFVIEYLFVLSMIMMHLSRLSEDIIIWLSPGYKLVEIDESFMTGSSLLPQKKNPDMCELARGKTGRAYGNLIRLLTVMKGLPLSYNRDMQEDKEALFDSNDTVQSCLELYAKIIATLRPLPDRAEELIGANFGGAQHLVELLVKKGMEFRRAHALVGRLVRHFEEKK
jgi:argininosuccinate lyase